MVNMDIKSVRAFFRLTLMALFLPSSVALALVEIEVNATFTPATIVNGDSSLFRWSSQGNVSSCFVSGVPGLSGRQEAFGSISVSPASNLQASVNCIGSGPDGREVGFDAANLTVVDTAPVPTVNASFNPTSIFIGQSSTLSWSSTNASSCSANSGVSISGTSGSIVVTPSGTLTVTVTCSGAGGSASDSATVSVSTTFPPFVSASFLPSFVSPGGFSTLFWSSSNADFCNLGGPFGTRFFGPLFFSTFETVICFGPGGTGVATAFVSVVGFGAEESFATQELDQKSRAELGLTNMLAVSYLQHDFNDDGQLDQLIHVPERQQLLLRLSQLNGSLQLIKVVNEIDRLEQVRTILIQQDLHGIDTVQVIIER